MKKKHIFGVRGDLHARVDISRMHIQQIEDEEFAGIFDLGDVEAPYIDKKHSLRTGQNFNKESTMDAIIRNSLDEKGNLTSQAQTILDGTLIAIKKMNYHIKELNESSMLYRGMVGNSQESWTKIFNELANQNRQQELKETFESYNGIIRDARAEFYIDGEFYTFNETISKNLNPKTGILYLPWKSRIENVEGSVEQLQSFDLGKIVLFSHDYLTMNSIAPEYREWMRSLSNEEQVVTALDGLAETDAEIIGFYGHIGFQYKPTETKFLHNGKTITAHHIDEKGGELLPADLLVK